MSATFLILINLNSSIFCSENVLSDSSYSFFPNAILVFTHADLLIKKSKRDEFTDYSDDSTENRIVI